MALPIGVHKRGAVFHIQIKIPAALRSCYPTPFFVRKSLGTEDRSVATAAAHRLWAEATEDFARSTSKLTPREFTTLTPALAAYVLQEAERNPLAFDDVLRFEPGALLALLQSIEPEPRRYFSAPANSPLNIPTPEYLKPSPDGSMTLAQLERLKALQTMSVVSVRRSHLEFAVGAKDARIH